MGNRAVVSFKGQDAGKAAIYLHWNGGPESVLAFIDTLRARKWTRMDYISARFVSVVVELFDHGGQDNGYSVGIIDSATKWASGCDNGGYTVEQNPDSEWVVTQRCNGKRTTYRAGKLSSFEPTLDEEQCKRYREIMRTLIDSRAARTPKSESSTG